MNKIRIALITLAMTMLFAFPAMADWKLNNTGWWYENDNGTYPANAWQEINGEWYFFDGRGYMAENQWIGNYYVGSDGAMLKNTRTPDNYLVGSDGAWIDEGTVKVSIETARSEVLRYYNNLHSSDGNYFIFDHEVSDDGKYYYMTVRYQLTDAEAAELIAGGGTPVPNAFFSQVMVDKYTGVATDAHGLNLTL